MIKNTVFLLNQKVKKSSTWSNFEVKILILDRSTFRLANLTWEFYSTLEFIKKNKKINNSFLNLVSFKNNLLQIHWWSWNWIYVVSELIKLVYWWWATILDVSI